MCGTKNSADATTCKSCGYTFETFNASDAGSLSAPEEPTPSFDSNETPTTPPPATLAGSPLFEVNKSLTGSVIPLVIYLLFIGLSGLILNVYFVLFILIFVLMTIVPILTSPRKYEFYSDSLKLHKIVGSDSEILYSNMTLYDSPRRGGIGLLVEGQRRPILISGNPMNTELNQTLKEFLEKKLKKYETKPPNQPTTPESPDDADTTIQ